MDDAQLCCAGDNVTMCHDVSRQITVSLPSTGGAGKISGSVNAWYRRLTFPHIAAGSKTFFGKVRTDLIDKTYQGKPHQTRAIAGIVKKTHSTSRLKNCDFSGFMS